MIKTAELSDPRSCMSRARPEEMVFVLLARDAAAPEAIRSWVLERLCLGKNNHEDAQIKDALACARAMEEQRRSGMFEIIVEESLQARTVRVIGTLDRSLSELKELALAPIDAADIQTVKHHAEDCVGLGNRVLEILKEKKPVEPVAWAVYDVGSEELLEVTIIKPENLDGVFIEPLYVARR